MPWKRAAWFRRDVMWDLGVSPQHHGLEGGALAENRLHVAFSLVWLWAVTVIALLEKGEDWRACSYSHCGQEFPACSHPGQVTRGHSVSKRNRNPICQRGVVLWEKKLSIFGWEWWAIFHLVLIWFSWSLKPRQIKHHFFLSFSASLWQKCQEKLSSIHIHADTVISVAFWTSKLGFRPSYKVRLNEVIDGKYFTL